MIDRMCVICDDDVCVSSNETRGKDDKALPVPLPPFLLLHHCLTTEIPSLALSSLLFSSPCGLIGRGRATATGTLKH